MVEAQWEEMMASDFPSDAQERAQKIISHHEQMRQEAMKRYEVDGLMPYERQLKQGLKGE